VVRRASDYGVGIQELSRFAVEASPRPGLVVGYGAIPTARIQEGLHLLWSCFIAFGAAILPRIIAHRNDSSKSN